MKSAGGSGQFFGDTPMWQASAEKRRKQATYLPSGSRTLGLSIKSPAELELLRDLDSRNQEPTIPPLKRIGQATPDTATPGSSRPVSSVGSAGKSNGALEASQPGLFSHSSAYQ